MSQPVCLVASFPAVVSPSVIQRKRINSTIEAVLFVTIPRLARARASYMSKQTDDNPPSFREMELFSVQRYDEQAADISQQNENEILKNLMKRVEKRRRKLDKECEINENGSVEHLDSVRDDEQDDLLHKSKRSRKVSEENVAREETSVEKSSEQLEGNLSAPEAQKKITADEFKVLGDDVFTKKKRVDMVLPPWLANPTVIATELSENLEGDESIGELSYLSEDMRETLKAMDLKNLFPVQREVIPWILEEHAKPSPFKPRDICVSAPTGSGKTLAFAVPIVELLSQRVERKIRALVVLPVNELAQQVHSVFRSVAKKTNLSICLLSKSFPFPKEQSNLVEELNGKYYSKVDIIITTPGRLVEHMHATKGFCLKNLEFLVIDEADRIMDQIHHNWLYHLDTHVRNTSDAFLSGRSIGLCINDLEGPPARQPHKLLFSATLSQDPEKLQNLKLFQPKLFSSVLTVASELEKLAENFSQQKQVHEQRGEFVGKYTTPAELTEKYCITENAVKPLSLYSLIIQHNWRKFLCFANSAENAHRLAFVLQYLTKDHLVIEQLSASLSPKKRSHVLNDFAVGKINGLVCSDALARGIDISEVDIVVSYDVPRHVSTYIHRIGRTARAGRPGTAITLLNSKELTNFKNILAAAGKEPVNEIKVDSITEETHALRYTTALTALEKMLFTQKYLDKNKKAAAKGKVLKGSSAMTIMEKLQAEATTVLEHV